MADRIGTLLNRSGDGGEEVLIVSRGKERTRFRRRDELGWNFRVESTDSENVVEVTPKPKPASKPASVLALPRRRSPSPSTPPESSNPTRPDAGTESAPSRG